jgi:hypothetical protein
MRMQGQLAIRRWMLMSLGFGLGLVLGCKPAASPTGPGPKRAETGQPTTGQPAPAQGWGTLRGRIVYAGDKLPEKVEFKVDKDTEHCLAKGPLSSEKWVVHPENRGVRWAVVFLRPAKGESLPIHDSLKEPSAKEAILDQPHCTFAPHVLALREGQKLVAKNPDPIPHNVVISGLTNSHNVQVPIGGSHTFTLLNETRPLKLSCGAHSWMQGYAWVFEHPYYAVTDADGRFEIKLVPAGAQTVVIWHEEAGYAPSPKGQVIEIKPDPGVTDLGEILVKPQS